MMKFAHLPLTMLIDLQVNVYDDFTAATYASALF